MPKEKDLKTAEGNINKLVNNIKEIKSKSGKSEGEGLESNIKNLEKRDSEDFQKKILAVYINDLKILSKISRLTLKDGKQLYNRVYLKYLLKKHLKKFQRKTWKTTIL